MLQNLQFAENISKFKTQSLTANHLLVLPQRLSNQKTLLVRTRKFEPIRIIDRNSVFADVSVN